MKAAEGPQKGLLDYIFRVGDIPCNAESDPEQKTAMPLHQHPVGVRLAA
jgi:hypothetical protein